MIGVEALAGGCTSVRPGDAQVFLEVASVINRYSAAPVVTVPSR